MPPLAGLLVHASTCPGRELQLEHVTWQGESEYEASEVARAGAAGKGGPKTKVAALGADDDHFGDVELDDALLPA